jgi:hypothetical protein
MAEEWFHFEPKGTILHITLKGQWDESITKTYCTEYQKYASEFSGSSWGKIVDATKWDCASLSSEKHLKKLVDWSKKNNLLFQINVTNNSTMKTFQIQKIFKNKGSIDTHYVKTKTDALKWVDDNGYK